MGAGGPSRTAVTASARPAAAPAGWLEAEDVACAVGGTLAVTGVSLALARGELGALLGPSGSGKTTLLRAIAGLIPISRGRIALRGEVVSTASRTKPPEHRRIGVVFQDLALFPHLDVAGNVGFGLTHLDGDARAARIAELIARFELAGLERRRPHELSGGQQQRVAIARALAPAPDLLLLDEPFSSLDADLRARLRRDIGRVLRELEVTALLVTHDHAEALAFADRIGVIAEGRLRQWDTPWAVYHAPADAFVAGFVGEGTLLGATATADGLLRTALGELEAASPAAAGASRRVLVRPQQIVRCAEGRGVEARVEDFAFEGAEVVVALALPDGARLSARWPGLDPPARGSRVRIAAAAGRYPHFDA